MERDQIITPLSDWNFWNNDLETGSDTAIVARATTNKEIFSKDVKKKLEVREIIAMPLKKK